jgi:hypothetical protein
MPLFLDGHLPSPRWRGVAWFYRLLAVPGIDSLALLPGAQPGGTALVGVAAVSMIMRLRRAKEANVNSSICWPTRRSCLLATFYLPTCTRVGRSAAFHPCSTRQSAA